MTVTSELPATIGTTHDAPSARDLEDLIREHMPLVGYLVRELLNRVPGHVHADDLSSAGFAALLDAARSFDVTRGIPFHRFAAVRIRGALLDELRGQDWASRLVRARARRTAAARQELTAALGRTPTDAEVAEFLGIGISELSAVDDDVQKAALLSLQGFPAGAAEELIAETAEGPEDLLLKRERLGYLHQAIQALPERLRMVVTQSFLQERPLSEVAAELGVTESRISQLRTEALRMLREGLNSSLAPELLTVAAGGPRTRKGCMQRRRTEYFARVTRQGNLHTRLALTDSHGVPVAVAA
ncbi:RNA polymerase sigma-28 (SigD/FliA/WhiG) subunit [Krasilnikovia cinnamomea]|uniref:RNA polymerase sigma-28 (SigD/FliA/WhiG) subunit n=1 Tax=Krasilnikovia cinnamomea TaxID=349313 RepID=A0A4Q7ZG45_9ACTN|nr:sigma-70 family RNA polymerase sigma factor [Krasilnikovia cinnamomea]RZU48989.1 RNA polymerase sigma-28 (SigD/FliA/WhiG) subunit [Krasilnikovia cinnamomea]